MVKLWLLHCFDQRKHCSYSQFKAGKSFYEEDMENCAKGIFPVVAVCPEHSVNEEEYSRFRAAADSVLRLSTRNGQCVAESTMFKRSGKPITMCDTFKVTNDLNISSEKFVPSVTSLTHDDPTRSLDKELKSSEKEFATNLQLGLPFTSSNKQADLINLRMADRKVRVGGQIIYTPDKEDDFDDSDPDDDLNL
uniref:Elongator complex protein 5 n=1 Tax=Angiostrongylus cantonensis TaxID=6313 RepID=A0A0K0CXT2_ANGCA